MENEKLETLSRAEVRFRFKQYRYPAVFCIPIFYLPFYNSHLNCFLISYLNRFLWPGISSVYLLSYCTVVVIFTTASSILLMHMVKYKMTYVRS